VLLAADGLQNREIADRLGEDVMKVGRWRHRYAQAGLPGILKDKSRPGRIPPIRRGVFQSVGDVTSAIERHIDAHNDDPKPYIWTARASDILEKVKRGRRSLHNIQSA